MYMNKIFFSVGLMILSILLDSPVNASLLTCGEMNEYFLGSLTQEPSKEIKLLHRLRHSDAMNTGALMAKALKMIPEDADVFGATEEVSASVFDYCSRKINSNEIVWMVTANILQRMKKP